jgi:hypothetical protein
VGGLVVCRQAPPTAKGSVLLTLEDEHGLMNVLVRPDVHARYRGVLRSGGPRGPAGGLTETRDRHRSTIG